MFNRILVPLDGSALAECVLPHIIALYKAGNPEVHLLRVLESAPAAQRARPVDAFDWHLYKAEADTYLKNVAQRLRDGGISVQEALLEGKAAESVIHYTQEKNIDLIVLSSHGQSGLSGWNVSSIVQKIILRAGTSVMIVRAYQPAPPKETCYQCILLPLDGSQRAECTLPVASSLEKAHSSHIIATQVVHAPEMPSRTPLSQQDIELANMVVERNRVEAEKYLDEIKHRLGDRTGTRLLVDGNVPASLQRLAEEQHVDLVILSAHGYTGSTKWPYGSTVISFIAYGTTPLLIVQDVPRDRLEPSVAELAAVEKGGR